MMTMILMNFSNDYDPISVVDLSSSHVSHLDWEDLLLDDPNDLWRIYKYSLFYNIQINLNVPILH